MSTVLFGLDLSARITNSSTCMRVSSPLPALRYLHFLREQPGKSCQFQELHGHCELFSFWVTRVSFFSPEENLLVQELLYNSSTDISSPSPSCGCNDPQEKSERFALWTWLSNRSAWAQQLLRSRNGLTCFKGCCKWVVCAKLNKRAHCDSEIPAFQETRVLS